MLEMAVHSQHMVSVHLAHFGNLLSELLQPALNILMLLTSRHRLDRRYLLQVLQKDSQSAYRDAIPKKTSEASQKLTLPFTSCVSILSHWTHSWAGRTPQWSE
jgi:hypothetical protein